LGTLALGLVVCRAFAGPPAAARKPGALPAPTVKPAASAPVAAPPLAIGPGKGVSNVSSPAAAPKPAAPAAAQAMTLLPDVAGPKIPVPPAKPLLPQVAEPKKPLGGLLLLAPLDVVDPAKFCPTEGGVARAAPSMHVESGAMRGFLSTDRSRSAEIDFTYRGPSKDVKPLLSGEVRRQIGVKLKAQDTCNVIYAMWHVEPDQGIFVALKRNPGKSTYDACKDGGYTYVNATVSRPVAPITPGVPRKLRVDLDGVKIKVIVDGASVWEGLLPPGALEIDGPPGVRTDNGTFDFQMRVPGGAAGAKGC
jgi:hypothetical protein